MVFRLVVDAVRRDKWQFLIWVVQIGNFSRSVGFSAKVLNPLAFAMVGSLFLAAISTLGLGHRSVLQLPISRRTWWLARWWKDAAVVPMVAILAAMGGAATGAGPALSIEQGGFWILWTLLYAGCWLAILATPFGAMADRPVGPGWSRWEASTFGLGMLSVMLLPFIITPYLPTRLEAISMPWAAALAALVSFTTWGYFYQPPSVARPSLRTGRKPAAYVPRHRWVDRLTGWRFTLWRQATHQLSVFATIFFGGAIVWAGFAIFHPPMPSLAETFRRATLLPFESATATQLEPMMFGALFLFSGFGNMRLPMGFRAIRWMPFSSVQLACMPLLEGLISATALWVVLLAIHVTLSGTIPASLRFDLFVTWTACAAMSHLLRTTLPLHFVVNFTVGVMVPPMILMSVTFFEPWRADRAQPAMLVGSIVLLLAISAVMFRAITRSPRLYRANPLFQGRMS